MQFLRLLLRALTDLNFVLVLAVFLFFASVALNKAQAQQTLPEVKVAAPTPRRDLQPQGIANPFRMPESSSANTQYISREEIEQLRPRDIFDLVNFATGVVATQGSRKGFSGLTIRGDSNFIWIVDGAYLQSTMASRVLSALPVMAIEEVQIVRGGGALTLAPMVGTASPGGAPVDGFVIVRTRKPERNGGVARLAVESNHTVQGGVLAGIRMGDGDRGRGYVSALGSYQDTDGPSEKLNNGAPYNAARTSANVLGKAGFEGDGWLLDFMAFHSEGSFQIQNANSNFTTGGGATGSWYIDPARTDIYVASGSKRWNDMNTTVFSLSRSESRQVFYTANNVVPPATPGPYTWVNNDSFVTHLNARHNIEISKARIMLGGDYMHWDTPTGQQYYEGIKREEKIKSWFAQVEKKFAQDRIALDASLRRDRVHILHGLDYYTAGAAPFGGATSPLRTTGKVLPYATFATGGVGWSFHPGWKLTTRYGESSQETSGLNPAPGTSLSVERQEKFELGVEGSISRILSPALNLFHRKVQNEKSLSGYTYIATNNATFTCRTGVIPTTGAQSPKAGAAMTPCYTQADTARQGFEISLSGAFAELSRYRFSWTHFTKLKNTANSLGSTTPKNVADLTASHAFGEYTVSGALKRVSRYSTTVGGYTRLDLGVSRQFRIGEVPTLVSAYGRNLGDEKYETSSGIQDVGRVIGIEAQVQF